MNRTPDNNEHSNPIARAFSKFFERGDVSKPDAEKPAARGSTPGTTKRAAPGNQSASHTPRPLTGAAARPATPVQAGAMPPRAAATAGPSGMAAAPAQPRTHTVAKGESLSKIAQQVYGSADRWPLIFDANRDQISDPDLIRPGQVLKLPDAPKPH